MVKREHGMVSLHVNNNKYMIFHSNRKQVNPLHLLIDNTTVEFGLTLYENLI